MDTNECRSSLGAHSSPRPAAMVMAANARRTCQRSSGVPSSRQNTRPWSCQVPPAGSRSAAWLERCSLRDSTARSGSLRTRLLLRVLVSPLARTDRYTATVPASRSTSAQVSARASSVRTPASRDTTTYAARRCSLPGLAAARSLIACSRVMARDGRPSLPSGRMIRLATLRRTLSRACAWRIARSRIWWNQPERAVGQFLRPLVHPLVQVVGRQLLEPGGSDVGNQVVAGERPVVVDRLLGLALHSLVKEVVHRLPDRVVLRRRDPGF